MARGGISMECCAREMDICPRRQLARTPAGRRLLRSFVNDRHLFSLEIASSSWSMSVMSPSIFSSPLVQALKRSSSPLRIAAQSAAKTVSVQSSNLVQPVLLSSEWQLTINSTEHRLNVQ